MACRREKTRGVMKHLNTFGARDRESWRAWLAANSASEKEIWVVFTRKHTGERSISYEESVEEALCYGWIDSTVRRIDEARYARKFTPRTNCENWSELNKRRVEKCIREGRMTEAGLAKIRYSSAESSPRPVRPKTIQPPSFMTKALKADSQVWKNFNALPPSERRNYTMWIISAKREETRESRLKEAVQMLAANRRLGLK
jgi:uncharacterized protein YdeI (YjbR/CyaY-like superfamily)